MLRAIVRLSFVVVSSLIALAGTATAAENQPPRVMDDFLSMRRDQSLTIPIASMVAGGIALGGLPGISGVAEFDYTVSDDALTSVGKLWLTVDPRTADNGPPEARDDYFSATEDEIATVAVADLIANDFDPDGGPLTIVSVQSHPYCGSAALAGPAVTFTPAQDFAGYCYIAYTVSDGAATAMAYLYIDVIPVDDLPRIEPQPFPWQVAEDAPMQVWAAVLAWGAVDIDAQDALRVVGVRNPVGGSVTMDGDQIFFTPDPDHWGPASFEYVVSDGIGAPAVGLLEMWVQPENDAPRPAPDRLALVEDTVDCIDAAQLTGNDVDVDGGSPYVIGFRDAHGVRAQRFGSTVCLDPEPNFVGEATFVYDVQDDWGAIGSAVVTVEVAPVNDPPIAGSLELSTRNTAPITFTLPASDPDGDVLTYQIAAPQEGTLVGTAPTLTYVPGPGQIQPAYVAFEVSDGRDVARGSVFIWVRGCGDYTVEDGEQCDDGNREDGDGCDTTCTETRCGNGVATAKHARSVTFSWLAMSCYPDASIELWLNGHTWTIPVENRCSCGVPVQRKVIATPEYLDGNGAEMWFDVGTRGAVQLAWVVAEVDTGDGAPEVVLLHENQPGQAAARDRNACRSDFAAPEPVTRDFVEQCDDGNNRDGDGCSAACIVECDGAEPGCLLPCGNEIGANRAVADRSEGICFAAFDSASVEGWNAAAFCRVHYGTLPVIRNAQEEAIVRSLVPAAARPWLFLSQRRDGGYGWGGTTPPAFTAWAPGEPTANGEQGCVQSTASGWVDTDCEVAAGPIVCELPL